MVHPQVGLPMLAEVFGDLSGHDLDGPLPAPLGTSNAVKSAYRQASWRAAGRPA